jgi:hypothetical protein
VTGQHLPYSGSPLRYGSFDMPEHAGEEYRRRLRADYATLDAEHEGIKAQLADLAAHPEPGNDPDLISLLPETTTDLAELPADLQAELYAVFDIQIIWNAPMRQATITDTTLQIITDLLTRASDTDTPATSPADSPPTSANTHPANGHGSSRIPIARISLHLRPVLETNRQDFEVADCGRDGADSYICS